MATYDDIRHRTIHVNGINMHIAEKGDEGAPVILFIHGFPELWYTWRHQIRALSNLGYRAVAPDMRGYGDTDAPSDAKNYSCCLIVGDLVALIHELGAQQVFVVGHDWGATIAWWLCLFRPDLVKALVNTSVAYIPQNPNHSLLSMLHAAYGDDFYMVRFQVPGEMENEIAKAGNGVDKFLKLCFSNRNPGPLFLPKGVFKDSMEQISYPKWLSEEDVTYYRDKFTKTGFTGGFNYYRALDLDWELMAPWTGAQVKVPVKFIVGDLDLAYHMPNVKEYIHQGGMKKDVPLLQDVIILQGVAHFLQQEKPEVLTKLIYDYIQQF